MTMITGDGGGPVADINVTPMIDVLLVLLIIFLVIQPAMMEGILVTVPAVRTVEPDDVTEPLVLEIAPGPAYRLTGREVPPAELGERIRAALQERGPDATLFVEAAESLSYGDVIAVMDRARAAGAERVGIVPRQAVARGAD